MGRKARRALWGGGSGCGQLFFPAASEYEHKGVEERGQVGWQTYRNVPANSWISRSFCRVATSSVKKV